MDLKSLRAKFVRERRNVAVELQKVMQSDPNDVGWNNLRVVALTWDEVIALRDSMEHEVRDPALDTHCKYCSVEMNVSMAIWANGLVDNADGSFVCWPCAHERYLYKPDIIYQTLGHNRPL